MNRGPTIPLAMPSCAMIHRALPLAALLLAVLAPSVGRTQPPAVRPAAVSAGVQGGPSTDAATAAVNATLARQPKRKQPFALTAAKPDTARARPATTPAGGVAAPRRSATAKGSRG
ncbi:MAG: hypothetical protein KJT01_14600 [Gemmatimonadetes bacterium]|nr:hypothetical protein [Gemmatimonadota bacterium]